MEKSGQFHALAALPPVKSPRYSLNKRDGWPQKYLAPTKNRITTALP